MNLVYVTCENEEQALHIGHAVVDERLAACANVIHPMTSIYRWEGEVHESTECVLLIKAPRENFERLRKRVVQLHSYECPCVIAMPIEAGHAPYLEWLRSNSK